MTKTDSKRYYPTALALYITYFVLGIAATIMGQYKLNFAAQWGAKVLENGLSLFLAGCFFSAPI